MLVSILKGVFRLCILEMMIVKPWPKKGCNLSYSIHTKEARSVEISGINTQYTQEVGSMSWKAGTVSAF